MSSVEMASSEQQPLKKRKLYESLPGVMPSSAPSSSPPSQDEILQKRRNREEIQSVYECYRRIRYFVSQKDPNLVLFPDFEQSYLSLITASREFRIPDNTFGSPTITRQDNPVDSSINNMSQLSSLFANLCAKYNLSQGSTSFDSYISRNYHGDTAPSNTLWIGLPDFASPFFTYDDLMSICSLAVGNIGSVSRLIRANTCRGSCWFAEFNCVDAAVTVLKNIRSSPGMFFQIEFRNSGIPVHSDDCQFLAVKTIGSGCLLPHDDSSSGFGSQPGKQNVSSFIMKSETGVNELESPGVSMDNHGTPVQNGHTFQSTWPVSSNMERLEVSPNVEEKGDGIERIMPNPSLQEYRRTCLGC